MKTLPTALASHITSGTTTLAHLLKITRLDGTVYAFTSASDDVTISSVLYKASTGLSVSSLDLSAGMAVDNLELTTLDDGTTFTRSDVLGGRWRNAAFVISRYNWASPGDGVDVLMAGTVGDVHLKRNTITAELRGLQQYLQQPLGSVSSKTCRARFGDAMCTKSLASYTVAATVTSVASNQVFTASGLGQAADYFGEGIVTFTSGLNNGLSQKVKTFSSGAIGLMRPMLQTVAIGNTFAISAGCRKRLAEDCITKFGNVLNFQGEPHLPGIDALTTPAG